MFKNFQLKYIKDCQLNYSMKFISFKDTQICEFISNIIMMDYFERYHIHWILQIIIFFQCNSNKLQVSF